MRPALAAPRPDMRVFDDPAALSRGAAVEIAYRAGEAIRARGIFTVALAGGTTPRRLYELLADEREPFRAGIRWSRIDFFWGDERCVPPDHTESNFRMAQEALISRVPVPPENVHRIHGEDPDPSVAAEEYERVVRGFFESRGLMARGLPRLDLVLLGLGADGHTASLFPGGEAIRETSHLVAAPYVETLASRRPGQACRRRHVLHFAGHQRAHLAGGPCRRGRPGPLRRPYNYGLSGPVRVS